MLNTFEGGSNGVNITAANSGGASGDALGTVQPAGGWQYTTTNPLSGAVSARRVLTGTSGYLRGDDTTAGAYGASRRPFYVPASVTTRNVLMEIRNTADALMAQLHIEPARTIVPAHGSVILTEQGARSAALAEGWYYFELAAKKGTTTTDGRVRYRVIRRSDNAVVIEWDSADTTLQLNTGTLDPWRYRVGNETTSVGNTEAIIDDFQWGTRADEGWWGSAGAAAYAGPDQLDVAPGTTVTLTGSGGTTGGWSQVSGPTTLVLSPVEGSGGTQVTFEAPYLTSGGVYVLDYRGDQVTVSVVSSLSGDVQTNLLLGPVGSTVTVASSSANGSGAALATVQPAGAWTYIAGTTNRGGGVQGTSGYLRGDATTTAARQGARIPLHVEAGQATFVVLQIRCGPTATVPDAVLLDVKLTIDRTIILAPGADNLNASESQQLAAGDYVLEAHVTVGATASTGRVEAWLYDSTGALVYEYDTGFTAVVEHTDPAQRFRLQGGRRMIGGVPVQVLDGQVRWGAKASGPFGPFDPPGDAGADLTNVEPWSRVTLQGRWVGTWEQDPGDPVQVVLFPTSSTAAYFDAPATLDGIDLHFTYGDDPMTAQVLPVTNRIKIGGVMVPLRRRIKMPS